MSNKFKANVIGNGSFGKFLKEQYIEHTPDSNYVVLAVPAQAFEEVCFKHKGKTFINVCSVQFETNKICKKYGETIGVHPLFGHRSDPKDRRCIITTNGLLHEFIVNEIFKNCIYTRVSPDVHDRIMAKTHAVALKIGEKYAKYFRNLKINGKNIPDNLLPASVIKLRECLFLLDDMPKGTVDSIKSNLFINKSMK